MNTKFEVLTFKVRPNKPNTKIVKCEDGIYYVDLAAPPTDNQANEELIQFVAKEFKTAKSNIQFLSGQTARLKRLKIYRT